MGGRRRAGDAARCDAVHGHGGPPRPGARQTAPQSIRGRFGEDGTANAVHGSDSGASAAREIKFFFPRLVAPGPVKTGAAASEYLSGLLATPTKTLNEVLVDGLVELCKAKPTGLDAVRWLGEWLITNNPNRPGVGGGGAGAGAAGAGGSSGAAALPAGASPSPSSAGTLSFLRRRRPPPLVPSRSSTRSRARRHRSCRRALRRGSILRA